MSGQSLGLIETVGLAAAVEAADAAVKSANVKLTGYELTKGGGLVTVKLEGEVGAINAAVAAAVTAAARVSEVYAWKIIPRTANGIAAFIRSGETVGNASPVPPPAAPAPVVATPETTLNPVVNVEEPAPLSCQEIVATPPAQHAGKTPPKPEKPTRSGGRKPGKK